MFIDMCPAKRISFLYYIKGSLWTYRILGHFVHVKFFPKDSEKSDSFFFFNPHIKLINEMEKPKS